MHAKSLDKRTTLLTYLFLSLSYFLLRDEIWLQRQSVGVKYEINSAREQGDYCDVMSQLFSYRCSKIIRLSTTLRRPRQYVQ